MEYSNLLVSKENNICIITINRPEKLNALNSEVLTELEKIMEDVENDNDIKSVIITGAGEKSFVAGADISEFSNLNKQQAEEFAKRGQRIFFKIENCSKPVIAAVNGFALGGGCELAMCCHIRVCSNNAKFGQPEVNLGLIAGYGGTQRLTRIVGKAKSMELHMTGNFLNADEAYNFRLVNYVTSPETLLDKAKEILNIIHTKAPVAISSVITAVNSAENQGGLSGYETEISAFGKCFETQDIKEGVSAFLEKRKPKFIGK